MTVLALVILTLGPEALAYQYDYTQSHTTTPATCLSNVPAESPKPMSVSVAVIKPIFTSTPYSQYGNGSFYAFFHKYLGTAGNITSDLGWLSTNVESGAKDSSGWGETYSLYSFIESGAAKNCGLFLGGNVHVVSDIDVSAGALFNSNGSRAYDAVVIGHQEYVTRQEYSQLRLFVASGGLLVAMSSNEFYAEVRYDPITQNETFVAGHGGFAFNGTTARHGATVRPPWNTSGWFGSTYCCFRRFQYHGATVNASNPIGSQLRQYFGGTLFLGYSSHEENAVSNFTQTSIIATFIHASGLTVASYIHRYGRGMVVCLCVFGEDLIGIDGATKFFLVQSLADAVPGGPLSMVRGLSGRSLVPISVIASIGLVVSVSAAYLLLRKHRTGRPPSRQ